MEKECDQSAINGQQQEGDNQEDNMDSMDEDSAAKQKLNSSTDPSKIKFTSVNLMDNKNGEAKVDIHLVQTSIGMGKEELMKYANEPFWVRLRLFLFVLFWVGWIAMLVGAVIIILVAPRCPPAPKLEWYQKSAMYQVDVKSFKDGDGDGVGDLKGLASKLDYFSKLNVKTLLLNAFYSMAPITGGIVNHTLVDDRFGTMTDFDNLLAEMKKRDMKLVLDFVPNHSSDEHPWFKSSIKKESFYSDFYVWADSLFVDKPPNNWLSVDGGSSWEWNEERKQYYLHSFGKHKPDLNLRNEIVKQELEDIMRFWLDKGIDGFKVKSASHLVEDSRLSDEPLRTFLKVKNPKYDDIEHTYTLDQPENIDIFAEWKGIVSNYSGSPRILMAELSGQVNDSVRYYGNSSFTLVDFPLNMELTKLNANSFALDLKEKLEIWTNATSFSVWPNWVLGNEDTTPLADRVGHELVDGIYMVAALLRGTPITYYGDELGITSFEPHETTDLVGIRPMLWTNESGAGFTNESSFDVLPGSNHTNVQAALNDKQSHLKIFAHLNELRKLPAINFGTEDFPLVTDEIFSLIRVRKGAPGFLVVVNMGANSTVVDFIGKNSHLPETGRVEVRSRNINSGPLAEGDNPKIKLNNVPLESKQAVVFSFVPKFED